MTPGQGISSKEEQEGQCAGIFATEFSVIFFSTFDYYHMH
jgi:hypothetical protein